MRRLVLAALLAGSAAPTLAQTAIVPDTAAAATTGTTATPLGTTTVIDGGTRVGNNLFHSFTNFSLATGDLALWTRAANDGASIAHIVNRVTGGAASTIDGALATQGMPNASFWFVNPAGIVFGANASVAVPNAAHFSTAGVLRLADGGSFAVATPGGSVLSVAAPSAFGFLGTQGNITVNGSASGRFVPTATSLSLSAANIGIFGSAIVAGSVDFAAVGSGSGSISPTQTVTNPFGNGLLLVSGSNVVGQPGAVRNGLVRTFAATTNIVGSALYSNSDSRAGGGLQLRSGALTVDAQSYVGSFASSSAAAGPVAVTTQTVDVTGGILGSSAAGAGRSGDVSIGATRVTVSNVGFIGSRTLPGASGAGGALTINAGSVNAIGGLIGTSGYGLGAAGALTINAGAVLIDAGSITSTAFGRGDAGTISITSDSLQITRGASLSSQSANTATGNAGNVIVRTGALTIDRGGLITSSAFGSAATGSITIDATTVSLGTRAAIESSTFGSGNAGNVIVRATGDIAISDARIASEAEIGSTGNAGAIEIDAARLAVFNGGEIAVSTFGSGDAGLIDISAPQIGLDNGRIASEAEVGSTGDAGAVIVTGNLLRLTRDSIVTSSSFGPGRAGAVGVQVDTLTLDDSFITSAASGTGDGGDIAVRAASIALTNGALIATSTLGPGIGGDVVVDATTVALSQGSMISSDLLGGGAGFAGTVTVRANTLTVASRAEISSATVGTGDAGLVTVTARNITLDGGLINTSTYGAGAAGLVDLDADSLTIINDGSIVSETTASGAAGVIDVRANTIRLGSLGAIQSTTSASGNAGNIVINATDIRLDPTGRILSSQANAQATGNAGSIAITTGTLFAAPATRAAISTSIFNAGTAGQIGITARSITLDGAEIASAANGTVSGTSGSIAIVADTLNLINGGSIETSSLSPGTAGAIGIKAGQMIVQGTGSRIASENRSQRGGPAGSILIESSDLRLLDGGSISTDSATGAAGDITVLMPATSTLLLRARSGPASFITTSSGPGTGGIITIASPFLILSDGGSILAKGQAFGADVLISSNFYIRSADRVNQLSVDGALIVDSEVGDLSTGAEAEDLSFLDASSVLRGQCAAARTGGVSQLSTRITGPYVPYTRPVPLGPTISFNTQLLSRCG
ncbi:filamentous hemagglutinin N-terminal domain-containing protein [Sphingomonas sp. SUN039]|uniref:beta strand repeat-containing protein n=1 Tax=Sphingomonas sp. SUN039 TaxID=2937787 RepID=UPI002164CA93|nr:filamentous hemagglutinin N-terminal domain-containing protein [Sphingomonas sp. SUN039]UVO54398.1 filamentous hemagglutinin N-terminal domain-containing protein [Sphingomonas sp. SUN039]